MTPSSSGYYWYRPATTDGTTSGTSYSSRPEFIDISIVYALINFIGTVAVLKLFDKGTLGDK